LRATLACWRLLCCAVHLMHGALICSFAFPFLKPARRLQLVGWWCARLLDLLGVALRVSGTPRRRATLVVANHISWLDILAINAVQPVRFVSKADVRRWPLLGWLVACGGTLFIERERKRDALRVVHQVAKALQAGDMVALFPEGTTSDGHALLPFHANLLQASIATETPVQPVALRFGDAHDAVSAAAAYVGDTSLLQSLWWVVTARGLRAHVTWLPPQATAHLDRRALAERLREQIGVALNVTEWRSAA
jgi:1-acyl-sn-glycerol-3-phosphate acyltransferase